MSTLELIVVITVAFSAGGLIKGMAGMGLPLVALPVLATFLGMGPAVALVAVPVMVTNIWQTVQYRAELPKLHFLPGMLIAGAIGVLIGVWVLTAVPERALSAALGVLIFTYIGLRLARPEFRIRERLSRILSWPIGFLAGVLQGATGIASPFSVTFIHSHRLTRPEHLAAVSTTFLVYVTAHIIGLAYAGILDRHIFLMSLFAIIPAAAMMPVGAWLSKRIGQAGFDRAILILLGIMAVKLIASGAGY
jgi:hypothetical protein